MIDRTPPKLLNFKLPKVIDLSQPGAKITFEIEAADEAGGSGLAHVNIVLDRFVSDGTSNNHVVFSPGRNSADGKIVGTDTFLDATPTTAASYYTVGPGTPAGMVQIAGLTVSDNEGNYHRYTAAELESLGFNGTVNLVNSAAPSAPTASLVSGDGDAGSSVRKFEGTSQAGATIYLTAFVNGVWANWGKGTAGADGRWTIQTGQLADGTYDQVFAWAVDGLGNASTFSAPLAFDIWKDGLEAPRLSLPTDSQGFVRVDNPVVTGTGVPEALVTLFADGKPVGTGRVDNGGRWAILADTLADGAHAFTASQSTAAGNTSAPSQPAYATVAVQADTGLKFAISSLTAVGATADKAFIQNVLDDVAARFSEFIDGDLTIPLTVNVQDLGNAAGSAGAVWLGVDATGMPLLASALFNLASAHPGLYSQTDDAGAYHLYAHEMMHVLGFSSGNPVFNKFTEVQSDGRYFVGPNAVAINGGPVRLGDTAHFLTDRDLMHRSSGHPDSPEFGPANPWEPFSALDIAVLKDIGWTTKPVLVSADGRTFIAGSGKAGFDQVTGTAGLDTFFIDENRANFTGRWEAGKYKVVDVRNQTSHTLDGIERIEFADTTVALDIDGTGGQVYRLYQAVFGRTPDAGGLGFWIKSIDDGMSLSQAADQFVASAEFKTLYGAAPTSEEIVTKLYANVLHRAPDKAGFDYWLPIIERDPTLIEEVLVAFSESAENKDQLAAIIGNGFEYQPYG